MTAVTYIPRALPVFLMKRLKLSRRSEQFLTLVPYTAMGVLIFPGILSVNVNYPIIGLAGGLMAAAVSWKYKKITPVILSSVLTVLAVSLIINGQ
jgi:branched-subunit amino acid transport protein